ncbi:MAG: DUF924 family protein [Alphaproteobacteria bacterium]
MSELQDWKGVYDFWFPPGLDEAGPEKHRQMFMRWFAGGANADVARFAAIVAAAKAGGLESWLATPRGRLSLIIVLDQFPRTLFAGTPEAYACDPAALAIAEEGLRNGHYEALSKPWEKTFALLPLAHAEGPDHRDRLRRSVALTGEIAREAPQSLQALYQHSVSQSRGHLDVIIRFGRYPHRNPVLGRVSTIEERAYLKKGDFVHNRRPP